MILDSPLAKMKIGRHLLELHNLKKPHNRAFYTATPCLYFTEYGSLISNEYNSLNTFPVSEFLWLDPELIEKQNIPLPTSQFFNHGAEFNFPLPNT